MLSQKTMEDLYSFLLVLILLYTDDTIILAGSVVDLQKCLEVFEVYCNMWKLSVKVYKTSSDFFLKKVYQFQNIWYRYRY